MKKLGETLNVAVFQRDDHIWLEQGGTRLLVILNTESRAQFCDELRAILAPAAATPAAATVDGPKGCTVTLPSGKEVNHPIATVFGTGEDGTSLYLTDNDTDCGCVAIYAPGQWVSVVGHGDYVDPDGGDR